MKKVLVISYYFPPSGGPGVQRVLKFIRHLPKFGWEPIVLTVTEQADFIIRDDSLMSEIPGNLNLKRTAIFEPYSFYRKLTGKGESAELDLNALNVSQGGKQKLGERISLFLREWLFIPDARVGWLPFAFFAGLAIIRKHKPLIIFSSGPPNTVHLIAYLLKKITNTPWVADFRDPWFKYLVPERKYFLPRKIDHWMARQVVTCCDQIVTVCKGVRRELEHDFRDWVTDKIEIITNGYSRENFYRIQTNDNLKTEFRLVYVGSIFVKYDMSSLITAINALWDEQNNFTNYFKFIICGRVDQNVRQAFEESKFASAIEYLGYRNYIEALEIMQSATVLLLYIMDSERGKNIPTSKLYEYLGAGKPILALSPKDSDAAEIINDVKAGIIASPANTEAIKSALAILFNDWQKDELIQAANSNKREKYEMKALTRRLADIFQKVSF